MKINILPLLRGEKDKITFSYSCEAKDFSTDISEGEININGYIKNFSGYMLLEGDIDMAFSALCGRCAKTSKHSVKTSFSRPVAQKLNQEDDEYILASENGDVDITEAVEEAVFSEMPVRFLCKEDCKGLCPICGVDLNDTSCSCVEEKCDPRLAKLREYLNNLEE